MSESGNPHHLIMGELTDYLSGDIKPDTHDERYRQKIAKYLVNQKRFLKNDIIAAKKIRLTAGDKKAVLMIDFMIRLNNKTLMMIKYAPGSLVTRRLSTLGLSRVIESYQIPIVVFTNGEDAEILDGMSGKVIGTGLDAIPDRSEFMDRLDKIKFKPINADMLEKASRIAYACEVDGACPCDSDICVVE